MLQVFSLTLFALLVARILRAPRGSWRYIVGLAATALLASQFLPSGHPFRQDVAEGAGALAWLAVAMVPVTLYALWVRRLRLRSGVDQPRPAATRPTGLVQIAEDAALARDTDAALGADAAAAIGLRPEALSLAWRAADGALTGHLRVRFFGSAAEIEMLRVAPEARGQGIGTRLLAAAEGEARARDAVRITAQVGSWQALPFFTAAGFRPVLERPVAEKAAWHLLEKALT